MPPHVTSADSMGRGEPHYRWTGVQVLTLRWPPLTLLHLGGGGGGEPYYSLAEIEM